MDKVMPMTVQFRGATLYGVRSAGVVFIPLKPIVEGMGLNWSAQLKRIKRDPILSEGVAIMAIPFNRGGVQDQACLRLNLINGWLFTIDSSRIDDPSIRARVQVYQRECYEVLWRNFSARHARTLPSPKSAFSENRDIRLVHEARMIFGNRVAAKLWHLRDMPEVPGMDDVFKQGDLFDPEDHAA